MASGRKDIVQETGRWLRIGALTFSTLSPIINLFASRIREKRAEDQAIAAFNEAATTNTTPYNTQPDPQERLQAAGAALTDILAQLQDSPYRQDLLKRGEELTEDLKDRWGKLSDAIARSSSRASHAVAEQSEEISHKLAKRSKKVRKELKKHSRIMQHGYSEQDHRLWIVLGFGIGITAATIATFLLLRKRLFQPEEDEETPIQLPDSPYTNGRTPGNPTTEIPALFPINDQQAILMVPADATLIGIISTKYYYPVETSLDQLTPSIDKELDIVYFSTEEDAKAQGFLAAE